VAIGEGGEGMMCPYCRTEKDPDSKTKVHETRTFWDRRGFFHVRRRHECLRCAETFWTVERSPIVNKGGGG
jgi:transcriptional regulator NrdR family protein